MDPADWGKSPEETKDQQGREYIYEMSGLKNTVESRKSAQPEDILRYDKELENQ